MRNKNKFETKSLIGNRTQNSYIILVQKSLLFKRVISKRCKYQQDCLRSGSRPKI